MRLPTFAVLIALSACSLPQPIGRTSSLDPVGDRLNVSISGGYPGSPISLHVTRPAYVAVFELLPGGGGALVYPRGGLNTLIPGRLEQSLWPSQFSARSFGLSSDPYGPRYLFVVASENPLDLNRIDRMMDGGVGVMGVRWASLSAISMMETITWSLVPDLGDFSTWDTDYSVYWPDSAPISVAFSNSLVAVECRGRQWNVPPEYYAAVYRQLCVANTPMPNPRDSTALVTPGRRAPIPAGGQVSEPSGGTRPGRRDPALPPPAEAVAPATTGGGDSPGRRPSLPARRSLPVSEPDAPPAPEPAPPASRPEPAPQPEPRPAPTPAPAPAQAPAPAPAPERDRPTPASGREASPD